MLHQSAWHRSFAETCRVMADKRVMRPLLYSVVMAYYLLLKSTSGASSYESVEAEISAHNT